MGQLVKTGAVKVLADGTFTFEVDGAIHHHNTIGSLRADVWQNAHPGSKTAHQKLYRKRHSERLSEYFRLKHKENPEIVNSRSRKWYAANKERAAERGRQYRLKNCAAILARKLEYRKANAEKIRAKARKYYEDFPDRVLKNVSLRRTKTVVNKTVGDAIRAVYRMAKSGEVFSCFYCGVKISGKEIHIDHIIPVSRGGVHHPDNLCLACVPCNRSKYNKLIAEWRPELIKEAK